MVLDSMLVRVYNMQKRHFFVYLRNDYEAATHKGRGPMRKFESDYCGKFEREFISGALRGTFRTRSTAGNMGIKKKYTL